MLARLCAFVIWAVVGAAVRELFGLDPQSPAAVAAQRSGDVLAALEAPVHGVPQQGTSRDARRRVEEESR